MSEFNEKKRAFDESIYRNPCDWSMTNDLIFKGVFGRDTPECKKMLIDLCNSVLVPSGDDKIMDIDYLNPFNIEENIDDKQSILDIKAKTDQGEYLNIEMQVGKQSYYLARALYYWSKLYSSQLKKRGEYQKLRRTIGIHFLDHTHFEESSKGHVVYNLYDNEETKAATDLLEIHFVQMPLIDDIIKSGEQDLADWVTMMREINNPEKKVVIESMVNQKEVMHMAMEEYSKITAEDKMREQIEARQKWLYDYNSSMSEAKSIGLEEGREEGRVLGKEEGRAEGIAEGREEGKAEGREEGKAEGKAEGMALAIEKVVVSMYQSGDSIEHILRITGLTEVEVQELIGSGTI